MACPSAALRLRGGTFSTLSVPLATGIPLQRRGGDRAWPWRIKEHLGHREGHGVSLGLAGRWTVQRDAWSEGSEAEFTNYGSQFIVA